MSYHFKKLAVALVASLFTFLAGETFAAPLGSPIQLVFQDGIPKVGIQYSYEISGVTVAVTGTFLTSSLPAKRPVYFRFLDANSGAYTSDWGDLNLTGIPSSQDAFTISLPNKSALQTLKALPNVAILFSTDKSRIEANLDLNALCANFPRNFVDLTRMKPGCTPDKTALNQLPDEAGGTCSADLHKKFCSSTYDGVRDSIARQYHCVFQCK